MMNHITKQVEVLATQNRAEEFSRLMMDIDDAEKYHNRILHQSYDEIYKLEKDVSEREECIVENNKLFETITSYIRQPSEHMVRSWWMSFQHEADNINEDMGLERMYRLTNTYYLKMNILFDELWREYNGLEWDHLSKTLI
jgi:hypothetical protein